MLISAEAMAAVAAARQEGVPGAAAVELAARSLNAAPEGGAGASPSQRVRLREALDGAADARLLFLGFQYFFRAGDLPEAERLAARRVELTDTGAAELRADAGRAHTNLGLVLLARGRIADARRHCERALSIDESIGSERGVARDLGNLANVFEAAGELDRAEALNRRALELSERIGAAEIAAGRLANLGDIERARGRTQAAVALWRRAHRAFTQLGETKHLAELEAKLAAAEPRA